VAETGGAARFVVENYGDSVLAKRFGVTRYPAIFVDDVLVAKPKDFGFYGKGEGAGDGRYTPWKSAASHERFRGDLSRMIGLLLAGRTEEARAAASPLERELPRLPAFSLTDLDGRTLSAGELAGRVVVVEFWATWCPPCQGTLAWLGELKERYGDRVAVLAIAFESEETDVRKRVAELLQPFTWAIGTPEIARSFGDVSAVPTLFVFGPDGATAGSYFGAPPTLHADAEARVSALLAGRP
jgi:thiol-disulfide isomerase/thioredoxin